MLIDAWLEDPTLGDALASMPWIVDGVSSEEYDFFQLLPRFARANRVVFDALVGALLEAPKGDLGSHLLETLQDSRYQNPGGVAQALAAPWVTDGLSQVDAAALVSVAQLASSYPNSAAFRQLLSGYHVHSKTIDLPLSGEVNLWAFQNVPFDDDDDVPAVLESSVRNMEAFTQVAFPTRDVILLVHAVQDNSTYLAIGQNFGKSLWVVRYGKEIPVIRHETAHYYLLGRPTWLMEGGSNFLSDYVYAQEMVQSLEDKHAELLQSEAYLKCTEFYGLESILHFNYAGNRIPTSCGYILGEDFLLTVLENIGSEATGAIIGKLHLLISPYTHRISEQLIYDTFLNNTPFDLQDEFLEVYARLHGGPEMPDTPDDHAGKLSSATVAVLGEAIEGNLDYTADIDSFSFEAEEGTRYRFKLEHETLPKWALMIYSAAGVSQVPSSNRDGWNITRVGSDIQALWDAPADGTYYVSVENFAGESGTYTLTIDEI